MVLFCQQYLGSGHWPVANLIHISCIFSTLMVQTYFVRPLSRSINCFVPFKLVTKLVYFDERSLYFEQRFVSLHDGFVRAVALCKNTVVGGSARDMVDSLGAGGLDMPKEVGGGNSISSFTLTLQVSLWLESQQESSDKLRAESGSSQESSVQNGGAGGRSEALKGEEGGGKIKGL